MLLGTLRTIAAAAIISNRMATSSVIRFQAMAMLRVKGSSKGSILDNAQVVIGALQVSSK